MSDALVKTCSYCGREYPDDAKVCAVDQTPLTNGVQNQNPPGPLKNVSGVWRGAYGYEGVQGLRQSVTPFTLILKQGWLAHFNGTVTEDAPSGLPGVGKIDGFWEWPTIEFTKQMPVGHLVGPDGNRLTLREYVLRHGLPCENELPSPPILYRGTFLDANRVQGIWLIRPRRLSLPDGKGLTMPQAAGCWCAEFVSKDVQVTPTRVLPQPFFDKTLLPPPEVWAEANSAFRRLGKFGVAEAEEYLRRFEQDNIRFEINRDDSVLSQITPAESILGSYAGTAATIEIFVHPEDETRAAAIIHKDYRV